MAHLSEGNGDVAIHDGNGQRRLTIDALGNLKTNGSQGETERISDSIDLALRVPRPRPRPSSSLVTTFQTGHGWTLDAAVVTDTVDFALGTQAIKLVTAGAGSSVNAKSPAGGFTTVDLTAVDPILWVKVDDFTHLKNFYVILSSDNAFTTNAYRWDIAGAAVSQEFATPGTWTPVTLLKGDATVLGTPTASAIQWCEIRAVDDSVAPTTVHVNMVGFQKKQTTYTNGVVSFTFDDGRASQAALAKQCLDKYGYTASAFIIWSYLRDWFGNNAYMFVADVDNLHRAGWEIGVHADDGVNFHEPTQGWLTDPRKYISDILSCQKSISGQGWTGYNTAAYPHGVWYENDSGLVNGSTSARDVLAGVRNRFAGVRTTYPVSSLVAQGRMLHETIPPADPLRLRTGYVQNTTTTANVQSWIDEAKSDKSWLILTFHNLVTSGASNSTDYLQSDFQTIVDYVNSQGLDVRTVGQVLRSA